MKKISLQSCVQTVKRMEGAIMPEQNLAEEQKLPPEKSAPHQVKNEDGLSACTVQGKAWLKGALGMAICCGAPLLLIAAISFFGLSLGAFASGALSLAAVLACPVGMFLMLRMMMKNKN